MAVQKERERSKNRFFAMRELVERLEKPQARPALETTFGQMVSTFGRCVQECHLIQVAF